MTCHPLTLESSSVSQEGSQGIALLGRQVGLVIGRGRLASDEQGAFPGWPAGPASVEAVSFHV